MEVFLAPAQVELIALILVSEHIPVFFAVLKVYCIVVICPQKHIYTRFIVMPSAFDTEGPLEILADLRSSLGLKAGKVEGAIRLMNPDGH